jgi:hypothetical protein
MDPKRPLGVAVVSIFLALNAGVVVIQLVGDTPYSTRTRTLTDVHEWTPASFIVLVAVGLVAAAGLWRGHRWAWVLAMLVVGVSLVVSLYLFWLGDPPYLRMAVDVVLAFYLNQGAVREHFERRRAADEPGLESPP